MKGGWAGDWTDAAGKRHRKRLSVVKEDADRQLAKIIRNRDLALAGLGTELSWRSTRLADLYASFLSSVELRGATGYVRSMRNILRDLEDNLGVASVGEVTLDVLEKYAKSKADLEWANETINIRIAGLKRVFRHHDLSGFPKWRKLPSRRVDQKRPARALTTQELELLRVAAGASQHAAYGHLTILLMETGARFSEAVQVRWEDVDMLERTVHLRAVTTKTKESRSIPMTDVLHAHMVSMKAGKGLIFKQATGRPYDDSSNYNKWLYKLALGCEVASQTDAGWLRCHALRHTFATRLAIAGIPIQQAKYLTGHRTIDILLNVYTHISVDDVRPAMRGL